MKYIRNIDTHNEKFIDKIKKLSINSNPTRF